MKHLIWILLSVLVIVRHFETRPVYKNYDRVRITSVVYSDPINFENSQYIKLAGLKIYLPLFPEILYGDKITVEGMVNADKLKSPKLIKNYGTDNSSAKLRNSLTSFFQESLPEPHAGLIGGIILGGKGGLTNDFWEKVKKVGLAHVVVASGTNVTFVTAFLAAVLSVFTARKKAIPFVILGIVLYLYISGFEAPLIRAAIMSCIVFIGQELGRIVATWRVLIFTALIMLIIKPAWLGDVGYILSFVSVGSIVMFEKFFKDRLRFLPQILKDSLSTSFAAQIGVSPILFVTFGQFNIWSPIVNALVLWTIPFIMILGSIGGVVGLVIPFLGKLILYLCYLFAWFFVSVVELFT